MTTSPGLRPTLGTDGQIDFVDNQGVPKIVIPPGVMFDAENQVSTNIEYALSDETAPGEWALTVTPAMSWLRSSTTTYPVIIDPTLINNAPAPDCWIREDVTYLSNCGASSPYLRAGRSSSGSEFRSILDFNVAAIPEGAVIDGASLNVFLDGTQSTNNSAADYSLVQAGKQFDSTARWSSSGTNGSWVGGSPTGTPFHTEALAGSGSGFVAFGGTLGTLVQQWVDGGNHTGLVLRQTGAAVNNLLYFHSSASAADKRPYLSISYTIPIPTDPTGGTYTGFSVGQKFFDTASSSALAAGSTSTVSTGAVAGLPSDPYGLGSVVVVATISNWVTSTGSVRISGLSGAPSQTVSFGSTARSSWGRSKIFAVMPTDSGDLRVENQTSGSVDIALKAVGWYTNGNADYEEDTSPTGSDSEVSIGTDIQKSTVPDPNASSTGCSLPEPSATSSEPGLEICTGAASIQSSTPKMPRDSDELAAVARGDSNNSDSADGPSLVVGTDDEFRVNNGSCFPLPTNTEWVHKRFEACASYTEIVSMRERGTGLGGTIIFYVARYVYLSPKNGNISIKTQLRYADCAGIGCNYTYIYDVSALCRSNDSTKICGTSTTRMQVGQRSPRSVTMKQTHDGLACSNFSSDKECIWRGDWTLRMVGVVGYSGPVIQYNTTTQTNATPQLRCDQHTEFGGSKGCAVLYHSSAFGLNGKTGSPVYYAAGHIRNNQAQTGAGSSIPFHRADQATRWANRRAACPRSNPYKPSCDEYPFASVQEGCANRPSLCTKDGIPLADNSLAGNRLGLFYRRSRISYNSPETFTVYVTT